MGMPQTLLAAGEILDVTFLLLRYIQSVDKEINVWHLCPLKRHIIVARIDSNDVLLEIEHFVT